MSDDSQSHRRKEYFQEHWEECDLPTEQTSDQPELHYQQSKKTKKKKSSGNRKLQRFRAKLKKRGLDQETIAKMINEYHNSSRPDQESEKDKETVCVNINMEDLIELHNQV